MDRASMPGALVRRVHSEVIDDFDGELEMEVDDERLSRLVGDDPAGSEPGGFGRQKYFRELFRLQGELVRLQDWVVHKKLEVVVLFEGRDAAGKGGAIKRITQRLNPRVCRTVALPAPSERERSQWYFQRYVQHLPAGGEIVLFDRSWYNRAGVERVMGFCTDEEYGEFFRAVPEFEKMLVRSGIILLKYWFSITDEEQHLRFEMRIHDPLKQWKLSPIESTHIPEARWWVIEAVDKKRARLNCIHHLLSQIPCQDAPHSTVTLPERMHSPDYLRGPLPGEIYVPSVY